MTDRRRSYAVTAVVIALMVAATVTLLVAAMINPDPITLPETATARVETRMAYREITPVPSRTATRAATSTRLPLQSPTPTRTATAVFASDQPTNGRSDLE